MLGAPVDPRHPRAPARTLTLGLAVLCLAAQLAGTVHLALVTHVTCAEHGELVEAGDAGLGPAARSRQAAPSASGQRLAAAEAREGAHGHEHCLASALRRAAAPLEAPGHLGPAPAPAPLARPRPAPAPAAAIALLAVAPKASPPAA